MIYKNIDIHNAAELDISDADGSMTWLRAPRCVYDSIETGNGRRMLRGSTGVELRFVINSGRAVIRMRSLSDKTMHAQFHIFRGAVQGGWTDHELNTFVPPEPADFIIERSDNLPALRAMTAERGSSFAPEVVRVIFDRGEICVLDAYGDIAPPKPEQLPPRTLLCYGSSITHGSNSIDFSHAWPSVLADRLDMDLRDLGMAGSCAMEPEMTGYIASEGEKGRWDTAVLELGINVLDWPMDKIYERVSNTLSQIAGRNCSKPVYVISPFYCGSDFHKKPEPDNWRRMIRDIVKEKAYPNVTYINGLDILGEFSLLSADEVHPNICGVSRIADRLSAVIGRS